MKKIFGSKKQMVLLGGVLLALILNLLYWGMHKEGYYCDELYSYHFVCQVEYPSVNGMRGEKSWLNSWYTPDYFMDYLTISEDEAFDFSGTLESIRQDVHPPVFYVLLEMICSVAAFIMPGIFSKWFGILLNLVFFILTLVTLFLLAKRMMKSNFWATVVCVFYGLGIGAVSTVVFIRMYMIFTFTCVLFTYLNLLLWEKLWKDEKKLGWQIAAAMIFTTVMGVLNHYYFLIYAFFVCVIIWGYSLFQKKISFTLKYTLIMAVGLLGSYLLWPEMITDIFLDYRGTEAFNNFTGNTDFSGAWKEYLSLINDEVFGGCVVVFLLLLGCGIGLKIFESCWSIKKANNSLGIQYQLVRKERGKRINLLFDVNDLYFAQIVAAVGFYVLLVAKIAPFRIDRYIFNIFPMVALISIYMMGKIFSGLSFKCFWRKLVLIALFFIIVAGYVTPGVNYLFQGTGDDLKTAENHCQLPTFYITRANTRYQVCGDSFFLSKARNIYPVKADEISGLTAALQELEGVETRQFLVYIDLSIPDTAAVLEKVMRELGVSEEKWLFDTEYSAAYVIE